MKQTYYWIVAARITCALLATLSIALFWRQTYVITALLSLFAILINVKSSRIEILFYCIAGLLGTAAEIVAISTGAWVYARPHLAGISIWLPLYWGMGGLVMKDLYKVLHGMLKTTA